MSGSFGWLHDALGGSSGINVPGPPQFSIQFNNPLGTFAGDSENLWFPSTHLQTIATATFNTIDGGVPSTGPGFVNYGHSAFGNVGEINKPDYAPGDSGGEGGYFNQYSIGIFNEFMTKDFSTTEGAGISIFPGFNHTGVGTANFLTAGDCQAVVLTQSTGPILSLVGINQQCTNFGVGNIDMIAGSLAFSNHQGQGVVNKLYGMRAQADTGQNFAGPTGSVVTLSAVSGQIFTQNMAVTNGFCAEFNIHCDASIVNTTIGLAAAVKIHPAVLNSGGGFTAAITNLYGIYIDDQSGVGTTISENFHSAGANSVNWMEGDLNLGKSGVHTGRVKFNGTTSGIVTLSTQDAAGTWVAKLPTSSGINGFVLTTDGGTPANLTWSAGPAAVFPNPQWNPIVIGTHGVLSAGNSVFTNDGTANSATSLSVGGHDGGKWYGEIKLLHVSGSGEGFGLGDINTALSTFPGQDIHSWAIFDNFGFTYHNNTAGVAVTTPVVNDVVQIAWDADTGKMWFGINNVWQNGGDPVLETNPCFTGVFGYLYLMGHVEFNVGQIAFQSLAFTPPQGYSPWGLAGQATKAQGSNNSVQYNSFGGLGGAANFFINSGNPNVTPGGAYLYNGINAIIANTANSDWHFAGSGNLTMSGSSNSTLGVGAAAALTTGSSNTIIGVNAGAALTSASQNTAIGVNALVSATTLASNCVAIGFDAMENAPGGNSNVGIGFQALQNVSGNDNVGLGNSALFANMSGSGNLGMGSNALAACTTGGGNCAVGTSALSAITSGANNVGLGTVALGSSTTGQYNMALGAQALFNVGGQTGNVGIGYQSGYINATGDFNIAIGYQAYGNTAVSTGSGSSNIIIGNNSGFALTSGSNNIIFSVQENFITTGSNNVVIGNGAGSGLQVASGTASNQLDIMNFIYGTGLSGSGSTISTGKIGIGIKAPAVELDVNGSINVATGKAYEYNGVNAIIAVTGSNNWYLCNSGNLITSGIQNIAIGPTAQGSMASGDQNTSIGYGAMSSAVGGTGNLAMGYVSLANNTTGTGNNAIGTFSLNSNTTGSSNSADGDGTLQSNTTGSQNVANGFNALNKNTIGTRHMAMGYNAQFHEVDATENVGLGYVSLQSNIHGNNNTAIGAEAMAGNGDIGDNNTSIGRASATNVSGVGCAQNTVVGAGVAFGLTSGFSNTMLGYYPCGTSITTGSNNLILGDGVDPGSNVSGKILIGCNSITQADYGLTNASQWTLHQTNLMSYSLALTNGAAASLGTLTNAPAAGNPTKWIPINDNGTTRYIPAW